MSAPEQIPTQLDPSSFDEPWQAQVFAIVVALSERGLFTWKEWTEALGQKIASGPQDVGNAAYFDAWLQALETLLVEKHITTTADLASIADDWREAAEATPHGQPIVLGARR